MKINNEDGYVLVLGIIILGALIILVFVMTNIIGMDLSFYRNNRDSDRAFYAAESGVSYATEVFEEVKDGDGNLIPYSEDESTEDDNDYIINISSFLDNSRVISLSWEYDTTDPVVFITSTGISNGKERTIKASYQYISTTLTNAIAAGETINLKNNMYVDGDLSTPDSENIVTGANYKIDGNVKDLTELISFNIESYLYNITNSPINTNNYDPSPDLGSSPIQDAKVDYPDISNYVSYTNLGNELNYVNGNVMLNGNIEGDGVLVVNGSVSFGNNFSINSNNVDEDTDDYFSIIVNGNIYPEQANKNKINGFLYAGEFVHDETIDYLDQNRYIGGFEKGEDISEDYAGNLNFNEEGEFVGGYNIDGDYIGGNIYINNSAQIEGSIYANSGFYAWNTADTEQADFIYNSSFLNSIEKHGLIFSPDITGGKTPWKILSWEEVN